MAQEPLAPPPQKVAPDFDRWMYRLWTRLTKAGQILWDTIDFTGSSLLDIATRPLTGINANTSGSVATVTTLEQLVNYSWSAGIVSGCAVTDNGNGTVAVAAGEALLRASASETAQLVTRVVPATNPVTLTDNDANYVYASYSGGTVTVLVTTDVNGFNCLNTCLIAVVGREGTHLHILDTVGQSIDANRKHRRKLLETIPYAHVEGGCVIGTSGRYVTLSAGAFWFGLAKFTHSAFNTSGSDTISTYYRASPSGWTKTTGVTQFPNTQYDNGSGTLATLGNNKYGVVWIYVAMGSTPHLALVYGQAEYPSAAEAGKALEPSSLPPVFESSTFLVGRIAFEKNASSAVTVDSPFKTSFSGSVITTHNNLSGLQGGTLAEYYHLTATEYANLNAYVVGTTTNDNAAAGIVGEYTESLVASGSAVSLTTATAANVTSISLTAGDWDVRGLTHFLPDASTTVSDLHSSLSTTSATEATAVDRVQHHSQTMGPAAHEVSLELSAVRFSLASTTTVYLVAKAEFAASTMGAYGALTARRVR